MRFALRAALIGLLTAGLGLRAADDWPEYNGGPERNHYSTLRQIDRSNVRFLRRAWEYHTGDFGDSECNPIVVGRVLYGVTARSGAFALDAATGKKLWQYEPGEVEWSHVVRGVTYWRNGDDERVLFTAGPWLIALAARTGKPIAGFGQDGKTSLRAGLGPRAVNKPASCSTPGALFRNLIVMPLWTSEDTMAVPGNIQAFDVRTGKLVWVFHTIPQPGEPGYETWRSKEAYKNIDVGSANCWAGMAVDRRRGIIYAATGSVAPDFWGGHRKGNDLYANCLIALQARTGKLLWYYQIVHHDLWDRDLPAPPNLLTVHRDGRAIDAVAQVTKAGLVFVFDRVTGQPLFPIREMPVPASTVPGEETSPNQPRPGLPLPFTRQLITEDDISPLAQNRDALIAEVRSAKTAWFQPFGEGYDTLVMPGFSGGAEWGGAAIDPAGTLYINANNWAYLCRLRKGPTPEEIAHLSRGHQLYDEYCTGCHGLDRSGSSLSGFPSLLTLAERRRPEDVMKQITTGSGRMPGFTSLTEADRRALVDFLFGMERAGDQPGTKSASTDLDAGYAPYMIDGYREFLDPNGYPATRPPWGTLTAIDLNTGRSRWQVPLGEYKELTAKGIAVTGTENWGGPVATASGLLFMAGTMDNEIRAFDCATGKILWSAPLPAGGFATPSTYAIDGKQYVVISCGGGRAFPGTTGDSYVAFSLP